MEEIEENENPSAKKGDSPNIYNNVVDFQEPYYTPQPGDEVESLHDGHINGYTMEKGVRGLVTSIEKLKKGKYKVCILGKNMERYERLQGDGYTNIKLISRNINNGLFPVY